MKTVQKCLSNAQKKILAMFSPLAVLFAAYIFINVFYTVTYEFQEPTFKSENGKLVPAGYVDKVSEISPEWDRWEYTWWIWGLALVGTIGVELYLFKPES